MGFGNLNDEKKPKLMIVYACYSVRALFISADLHRETMIEFTNTHSRERSQTLTIAKPNNVKALFTLIL